LQKNKAVEIAIFTALIFGDEQLFVIQKIKVVIIIQLNK